MKKRIWAVFITILFSSVSWGTQYYVDPAGSNNNTGLSWQQAFATIQHSIDVASAGDFIDVNEGTYSENINFNGKAVTIRSTDPNNWDVVEATVIAPNNYSYLPTVTFENDENINSVFTGFTVTNGYSGIVCEQASPVISNCIVEDNYGFTAGGIFVNGCSPLINECIIRNNSTAYSAGGGIFNSGWEGASNPIITNCTISNNNTDIGGGAIANGGDCAAIISNCLFTGNYATWAGGAIINYSDSSEINCSPTITNCTFVNNTAGEDGGAICNWADDGVCSPEITNCILWNNDAHVSGDEIFNYYAEPNFSYCDIEGGLNGSKCAGNNSIDGNGNINSNPYFVDIDANDLHLLSNSPCIDVGDPDGTYTGQRDIDGDNRVIDIASKGDGIVDVDMGADEIDD